MFGSIFGIPNGRFMSENATKKYIIETAFRLFLRKTFKEVTMKELVEESGLSKGAFYHYFSSKEDLYREVLKQFFIESISVNYNELPATSFRDFYRAYLQNGFNQLADREEPTQDQTDRFTMNHFNLMFEGMRLFPEIKEQFIAFDKKELLSWEQAVDAAKERGEIKSQLSSGTIARLFLYMTDAVGIRVVVLAPLPESEAYKQELQTLWDELYNELT